MARARIIVRDVRGAGLRRPLKRAQQEDSLAFLELSLRSKECTKITAYQLWAGKGFGIRFCRSLEMAYPEPSTPQKSFIGSQAVSSAFSSRASLPRSRGSLTS